MKVNKVVNERPEKKRKFDWEKYKKDMEKARNYLSKFDWSDVEKIREESKFDRFPEW
jgi:hypothetical protein